jgi:hypothetical protein
VLPKVHVCVKFYLNKSFGASFNCSRFSLNSKFCFPNVILAGVFGFSADAQNLEFSENLEQLNEAPKDLFK